MSSRRIELLGGLAAGLMGLLGLAYAFFGPVGRVQRVTINAGGTTSTTYGSASLFEMQGLEPRTAASLAVLVVRVAGVAIGAYLHSQQGLRAGRLLLGVSTAFLLCAVVVTGLSIGMFLFPSLLLALLALRMSVAD